MVPPGADNDEASSSAEFTRYPEPPYSVELLADLHADVLAPDVAAHIRSRLADDPHARSVLDALDATARQLRGAAVASVPVPPDVTERTRQTLDRIGAEVSAIGGGTVVVASRRRHRARRWAAAGAAGAAAVAVVATVSVIALRAPEASPPVQAQPSATADPGERVTLLSVLGNDDFAPFGSESALRRCTAANGVAADAGIVGSGRVSLPDHDDAVAILLSTGVAGVFDALVVGADCTTDNPSTISRTTIGN